MLKGFIQVAFSAYKPQMFIVQISRENASILDSNLQYPVAKWKHNQSRW